ncbi:MAG: hypothetical protein LBC68_01435 [Prevotellaceae bacterium]|jgi:hypothetical protein|nr:hypothetical protein [Prevotellaceae bacterium]
MRQNQSNYLNMASAVLQHFDNHAPVFVNVRIVASGVDKVRSTVDVYLSDVAWTLNNPAYLYTNMGDTQKSAEISPKSN